MRRGALALLPLEAGLAAALSLPAAAQGTSLRFYGNGVAAPDLDRVKVRIDAPARPADIGATDFTIEFWMKASAAENTSGPCAEGGDAWINGNILMDRDVYGAGDHGDFGVSLYGGRIAFGVATQSGADTICSAAAVATSTWRHVALTRRFSDGEMRIFVDGQAQPSVGFGPSGDASYRDGRATSYPTSDPFLVFGAEKHDAGAAYPSYSGALEEVRLSLVIRYTSSFTPPTQPFAPDAATAALYHFDEGAGAVVGDASGAAGGPSHGVLQFGGAPAGPLWTTDSPFTAPASFHTVTPCRAVDTRNPSGPWGGPALAAGGVRVFTLGGRCGIPVTARAVSVNLAVTGPAATGNLRLYPPGTVLSAVSTINYSTGQTRSNNALVSLGAGGQLEVRCTQASGGVHLILDVNGWFE